MKVPRTAAPNGPHTYTTPTLPHFPPQIYGILRFLSFLKSGTKFGKYANNNHPPPLDISGFGILSFLTQEQSWEIDQQPQPPTPFTGHRLL